MQNYLLFSVGNYRYGLRVEIVKEVIRISAFKPIPDQPLFVEGVINLRGKVIPLVDFRRRFLMGVTEKTVDKRIIICEIADFLVGFLVDSVEEVTVFSEHNLKKVSNENLGLDFKFIEQVAIKDDDLISILNADLIFSKEEVRNLLSIYTIKKEPLIEKKTAKKASAPVTKKKISQVTKKAPAKSTGKAKTSTRAKGKTAGRKKKTDVK